MRDFRSHHRRCFSRSCCSAGTCCDTLRADVRIRKSNILDGWCSNPGNRKLSRKKAPHSMKCRLSGADEHCRSMYLRCADTFKWKDYIWRNWILSYTFRYTASSRSPSHSSRNICADETLLPISRRHTSVYSLPLRQKAAAVPESLLPS